MNHFFKYTFFLLIFFTLNISAQEKKEISTFKEANKLYAEENFDKAIIKYEEILDSGYESADLYFNLANAYYRQKKLSSSIYYYEKAKLLAPDNEDIQENAKLAEMLVNNRPTPIPQIGIVKFFNKIITSKNIDFWAYISISMFVIALFSAGYFLISRISKIKKVTFLISLVAIFISALTFIFTLKQNSFLNAGDKGIVFSISTGVNSSPDENSTRLFDIYEGFKVKIADESGIWYKIILEDGKQGWIKKEEVKIL